MRAVGFRSPGGPEVVEVLDVPEPEGHDLLVVDVAGAAVNPVDVATRSGQIPTEGTTLLGWDLAGTVIRAPEGSGFAPGDRVAAMTAPLGTGIASMAERVALDPGFAVAVPASLDLLVAAALPLAGVTAVQTLRLADLRPQDRVLLVGAQGSVGSHVADRLLAQQGHVDLLVRPDDAAPWTRRLEASPAVGTVRTDPSTVEPGGYDVVIDTAGVPTLVGAVREGGRFVTITPFSAPTPEDHPDVDVRLTSVEISREDLQDVMDRAASGEGLLPDVVTLPLDEAAQAHARLEAGGVRGKLVLVP
ncbi:MAG: zinc-binding dehydrogenase [Propionibacteriales bacterium]|nr:zinc-binding dehydrogenase [Propionibacteriales bacterium]